MTYLNYFTAGFLLRLIGASSNLNITLCTHREPFSCTLFVPGHSMGNGVAFDVRCLRGSIRRETGDHNKHTKIGCMDDNKAIG